MILLFPKREKLDCLNIAPHLLKS